jgi:acetyl-CoA carboxylase carboxyl transferase subunit alpha
MPPVIDTRQALDFERPIVELENKIAELKQLGGTQLDIEIRRLERKARQLQREVFSELSAWQKVLLSRHPLRPFTLD